jgi:tight adherence protein B
MGIVVFLTCAGLFGLSAYVLLGEEDANGAHLLARARMLRRVARRLLVSIGSTRVVVTLLGWSAFREAAQELEETLKQRDVSLSQQEAAAMIVVGIVVSCGALGMVSRSLMVAIAAFPFMAFLIPLRAAQRRRNEASKLAAQMPGVLRTLATAMGAGQTLSQAIEYVSLHESAPAAEAFVRASLRLRCGMPAEEILNDLACELDAPGAALMATALSISQRTGSPLRELFHRSALLVEQQGEFHRTLSVKTAQVRLSVRIVCLLPIALVAILSMISVDFREGLRTVPGLSCLFVGALMDGVALMIIRSMLRRVL